MLVIGEKIKEKRMEKGMTIQELADLMGYNKSSISRIERGEFDIPQSRISEFAKKLGTTPGYLMGWEVEPENAGEIAAKVLKNPDTFQMVKDYLELSETDQYTARLVMHRLKQNKKKD